MRMNYCPANQRPQRSFIHRELPLSQGALMNATLAKLKITWCLLHRLLACLPLLVSLAPRSRAQTIHVDAAPDHAVNSFRPTEALGAGLDRISPASTDKILTNPTPSKFFRPAGKRSPTARTRSSTSKLGTGILKAPGATATR